MVDEFLRLLIKIEEIKGSAFCYESMLSYFFFIATVTCLVVTAISSTFLVAADTIVVFHSGL